MGFRAACVAIRVAVVIALVVVGTRDTAADRALTPVEYLGDRAIDTQLWLGGGFTDYRPGPETAGAFRLRLRFWPADGVFVSVRGAAVRGDEPDSPRGFGDVELRAGVRRRLVEHFTLGVAGEVALPVGTERYTDGRTHVQLRGLLAVTPWNPHWDVFVEPILGYETSADNGADGGLGGGFGFGLTFTGARWSWLMRLEQTSWAQGEREPATKVGATFRVGVEVSPGVSLAFTLAPFQWQKRLIDGDGARDQFGGTESLFTVAFVLFPGSRENDIRDVPRDRGLRSLFAPPQRNNRRAAPQLR